METNTTANLTTNYYLALLEIIVNQFFAVSKQVFRYDIFTEIWLKFILPANYYEAFLETITC